SRTGLPVAVGRPADQGAIIRSEREISAYLRDSQPATRPGNILPVIDRHDGRLLAVLAMAGVDPNMSGTHIRPKCLQPVFSMTFARLILAAAFGGSLAIAALPVSAGTCGSGSFEAWLGDFKSEAAGKGISQTA